MKKIFLLIFLTAAMQQLFAQSVKFGVKAGLNESTADLSEKGTTTSNIAGFNAGAFVDIEFHRLSIQPGVFYTTRGYKSKTVYSANIPEPYTSIRNDNVTLNYLEIPVNLLYHISAGPLKIFVGGGPYLGIGLSGTYQENYIVNGTLNTIPTEKLDFYKKHDFDKTDLGLNALTGVSLNNGLIFSVDYGYGIKNIDNGSGTVKNRVLSLSLGYEFL